MQKQTVRNCLAPFKNISFGIIQAEGQEMIGTLEVLAKREDGHLNLMREEMRSQGSASGPGGTCNQSDELETLLERK